MDQALLIREEANSAAADSRVARLKSAVKAGRSGYNLAEMSENDARKILSRRDRFSPEPGLNFFTQFSCPLDGCFVSPTD